MVLAVQWPRKEMLFQFLQLLVSLQLVITVSLVVLLCYNLIIYSQKRVS